jgi:hypothetical protein
MVTEIKLFEPSGLTPFNVCLWSRKKSQVYERKMNRRDESLAYILDAAASAKKREDELRRTRRDLRKRFAKCIEDDGGIIQRSL